MTRWVCLLRGINVGGNNPIKMTDLVACVGEAGLRNVSTYIASGNVLFEHPESDAGKLTAQVERALSARFGYKARVVLRSHRQLQRVVEKRPRGFGARPEKFRYDVIFLKDHVTAGEALEAIPIREGRRRGHRRRRRAVRVAAGRAGEPEPALADHRPAGVPAPDDPELEHHREAARAARRGGGIASRHQAKPKAREVRPCHERITAARAEPRPPDIRLGRSLALPGGRRHVAAGHLASGGSRCNRWP